MRTAHSPSPPKLTAQVRPHRREFPVSNDSGRSRTAPSSTTWRASRLARARVVFSPQTTLPRTTWCSGVRSAAELSEPPDQAKRRLYPTIPVSHHQSHQPSAPAPAANARHRAAPWSDLGEGRLRLGSSRAARGNARNTRGQSGHGRPRPGVPWAPRRAHFRAAAGRGRVPALAGAAAKLWTRKRNCEPVRPAVRGTGGLTAPAAQAQMQAIKARHAVHGMCSDSS